MSYHSNREIRRIYLAGKIEKNDWRHDIVDGLRDVGVVACYAEEPLLDSKYSWPVLEGAILGTYDYAGPFFIGCDHGCFHGRASHGVGASGINFSPRVLTPPGITMIHAEPHEQEPQSPNHHMRTRTLELCKSAIQRTDLLFAWIDTQDAFGTIAEIGYAAGLGKIIWIGGPRPFDELWLMYAMADVCSLDEGSPQATLQHLLRRGRAGR